MSRPNHGVTWSRLHPSAVSQSGSLGRDFMHAICNASSQPGCETSTRITRLPLSSSCAKIVTEFQICEKLSGSPEKIAHDLRRLRRELRFAAPWKTSRPSSFCSEKSRVQKPVPRWFSGVSGVRNTGAVLLQVWKPGLNERLPTAHP
jgi:hypothetical protein